MAQCNETAQEFIQNCFSPMVAVLASADAQEVCNKNNLTFVELIQPFCQLNSEAHIRDAANVTHTIRNMKVIVRDMTSNPPQTNQARKLLHDAVTTVISTQNNDLMPKNVVTVGNHDLQLDAMTPWFEAYRTSFFQVAYAADHEFLFHYLASADPMDQFSQLTQQQHHQQHQQQNRLPRWFSPNILHYYVLVHDVVMQEESKAEAIFQSMKTKYGVQSCHLLHINSRVPSSNPNPPAPDTEVLPNPWGRFVRREVEYEVEGEGGEEEGGEGEQSISTGTAAGGAGTLPHSASTSSLPAMSGTVIYDPLGSNLPPNHDPTPLPHELTNHTSSRSEVPVKKSKAEVHGAALTLSDHDRLRIFMHEFMVRGLVAWAEKTIRTLSEQTTMRKGISRGFIKKWFGGGKQTTQAVVANNTNVVYMPEAPEMQTRRLADLAFMFQMYDTSYQIYHTAKKDFNNDHALLHYAGAMEMACLSLFMQGSASQRQYPLHYMETTISTYLALKIPQHLATRATLLSTEILKSKGLYAEAAMQFIKMTSEESDLRSALLLEQAAHCFIKMKSPMVRKYAFHMVLAGHRFIKAGQKQHALRSYAQALQIFKGRDWTLAEDHINFTIGIQSFSLKQLNIATSAFKHLLSADSKQSAFQQAAFLREYLCVFKQCSDKQLEKGGGSVRELPQLPLPSVEMSSVKVLSADLPQSSQPTSDRRVLASDVSFDLSEEDNARFIKLEEKLIGCLSSNQIFRPTVQCFTNSTNNSANPLIPLGETFTVQLELYNPVKVALLLKNVVLLWKFVPKSGLEPQSASSEQNPASVLEMEFGKSYREIGDGIVEFEALPQVLLEGLERKQLHLSLSVRSKGHLLITGLAFNLSCSPNSLQPSQHNTDTAANSVPAISNSLTNHSSAAPVSLVENSTAAVEPSTNHAPAADSAVQQLSMVGRIDLEVQGPRLNSTRDERMGIFYGVDKRLNPSIVGAMPKLKVYFCQFPSMMFCGEVRRVTVELVNTGSRALTNVRLITSHQSFFSVMNKQSTNDQVYPSTAVDSTKTLPCLSADVKKIGEVSDNLIDKSLGGVGTLEPGASCSIPAWIRAPDCAGNHCVDFLIYYQPVKKKSKPDIKYRLVRHTLEFTTESSLSVRASCHRIVSSTDVTSSAQLSNSVVAVIDVENITRSTSCVSSKFSISQITCISPDWSLLPANKASLPQSSISNQECLQLTLQANSLTKSSSSNGAALRKTNVSSVSLDNNLIDVMGSVCSDFYFRSQISDSCSSSTQDSSQSDHQRSTNDSSLSRLKLEQCLDINLALIVLWKASVYDGSGNITVITGQHHITLNRINSPVASPPVVKTPVELPPVSFKSLALTLGSEGVGSNVLSALIEPSVELSSQLVLYRMRHPLIVSHCFKKNRICRVNISIELLNTTDVEMYADIDVKSSYNKALLSASRRPFSQINSSLYDDRPSQSFTWVGLKVIRLLLPPHSSQSQSLTACFSSAGLYDLSSVQVLAGGAQQGSGVSGAQHQQLGSGVTDRMTSSDLYIQRSLSPSFITIENSSQ